MNYYSLISVILSSEAKGHVLKYCVPIKLLMSLAEELG